MEKRTVLITTLLATVLLAGCSGTTPTLGLDNGQLMACPAKPNCVSSQADDTDQFVEPIVITASREQARDQIIATLGTMDRTIVTTRQDNYIRAESTSQIFRFVDDVEFYLTQSDDQQTVAHVRSASRLGYSDMGVNRKRVEAIRVKLAASKSSQ